MAGFADRVQGLLGQAKERAFPANSFGGLLTPEQQRQGQQQAQQAAALSLLQSGGPSRTPTSIGQAVGSALGAGNQANQAAGLQQLQSQLLGAQIGGTLAGARKDLADAEQTSSGLLQGTGTTNQMMNIVTQHLRGEAVDPTQLELAIQYLEKPRTITTPEGTYTEPGMNVRGMIANGSSSDSGGGTLPTSPFTPKPQSEGEIVRIGAASSLTNQENNLERVFNAYPDFNPAAMSEARGRLPLIGNAVASEGYQQWHNAANQWAIMKTKLMTGVTARPEELTATITDLFPEPGDSPATVAATNIARYQEGIVALQMGTREVVDPRTGEKIPPRISPLDSQTEIAALQEKMAEAQAEYSRLTGGTAAGLPEGVTEADITKTMQEENMTREEVLEAISGT